MVYLLLTYTYINHQIKGRFIECESKAESTYVVFKYEYDQVLEEESILGTPAFAVVEGEKKGFWALTRVS